MRTWEPEKGGAAVEGQGILYSREARAELSEAMLAGIVRHAEEAGISPYHMARLLLARYLGHRSGLSEWHRLVASTEATSDTDEDPAFLDSMHGRPVLLLAGFSPAFWMLLDRDCLAYGLTPGEWAAAVLFRYLSDSDSPPLAEDLPLAFGLPAPPPTPGCYPSRGDALIREEVPMPDTPRMPYMPAEGSVAYATMANAHMAAAKEVRDRSGCVKQRTGAVIVDPMGIVMGRGSNDTSHRPDECPRDVAGFKTGEGYEQCQDVCGQRVGRHAERDAIADAVSRGGVPEGSVLYLYGHWWCCKPCWDAMLAAGISQVYLLEGVGPDTDWGSI